MPAIRDGRGQLHVHDMGRPPVNPPGPIERSRVSEARLADFAAERAPTRFERARAANVQHRPGTGEEEDVRGKPGAEAVARREQKQAEKTARVLAAIRETESYAEAAERLGVSRHTVEMAVYGLRKRGALPDDLEQLLRARARTGGGRRVVTAADVEAMIEPEGGEAGAPATAAASVEARETPLPPREVATPPGPPDNGWDAALQDPAFVEALDAGLADVPAGRLTPLQPLVDEGQPTVVHLTITIDVVRLAEAMRSWPNYEITSFFDGLAKVIHEAQA